MGPSRASREGPRRLAGEVREVILGRIFKVDPNSQKNHYVLTCFVVYLRLFWVPFGIVCGLPCGEPGAGAYLEKTGFRLEGVSIFAFWAFARATKTGNMR